LLPAGVRTYAPRGQTPILRVPLTRDHLSAISAITPDGKMYIKVQTCAFRGPAIVQFLRHLLRHIPGKLLLIWDGLPAHRSHEVKAFLAQGAACRIHLEQLPSYAPDLNPDEGIWHYLKDVEMKNLCCYTLDELRYELRKATARLRHKPDVILACFKQARLGVQV
jgi:transposase